jgi:diaminopimelate epimerase
MGEVTMIAEHIAIEECRAFQLDVGNPHLVLLAEDLVQVDLSRIGADIEALIPGGTNVEVVVAGPGTDELRLLVWERGVGMTLACGSGSCAAALAANLTGLVGNHVVVHNPGGPLTVDLEISGPKSAFAMLSGPASRIGQVLLDSEELLGSSSEAS